MTIMKVRTVFKWGYSICAQSNVAGAAAAGAEDVGDGDDGGDGRWWARLRLGSHQPVAGQGKNVSQTQQPVSQSVSQQPAMASVAPLACKNLAPTSVPLGPRRTWTRSSQERKISGLDRHPVRLRVLASNDIAHRL